MKRALIASMVVLALWASSCTSPAPTVRASSLSPSSAASSPSPATAPFRADIPAGVTRVSGGCDTTQAYRGPVPPWLEEADGQNTPGGLHYVVASPPTAAGFIFGYPLRAGHPRQANKILWVVRTPRDGGALKIEARPLGASSPVVRESRPADSGPGEIYPDGLDVPTAGCWHLTLRWPNGRTELDLLYVAP